MVRSRSRPLNAIRTLAVTLALAGILLRGLLPEGWMPNTGTDAFASPLMPCSMDAPPALAMDMMAAMPAMPGMEAMSKTSAPMPEAPMPQAPMKDTSHAPCAFAAAAPLSPPLVASLDVGPTSLAEKFVPQFAHRGIAQSAAHRPNAARAPPFSI